MNNNKSKIVSKKNNLNSKYLSDEESLFLNLFNDENKHIYVKTTLNGTSYENIERFLEYFSEIEIDRLLFSLFRKKFIAREEKGTLLLCPKCGSHAHISLLACPKCGSTKINKKEYLNHLECQFYGEREKFIDGISLRCPRCEKILDENALKNNPEHFIISDSTFECQDCKTIVNKNNLIMVCIKCNNKFNMSQAAFYISVSYYLDQQKFINEILGEDIKNTSIEDFNDGRIISTSNSIDSLQNVFNDEDSILEISDQKNEQNENNKYDENMLPPIRLVSNILKDKVINSDENDKQILDSNLIKSDYFSLKESIVDKIKQSSLFYELENIKNKEYVLDIDLESEKYDYNLNSLNLFELNKCPIVFDLNKDDNLYKYVVKIKSIRKNNDRKIKLKLGISTISRNTDLDDNLLTANKS